MASLLKITTHSGDGPQFPSHSWETEEEDTFLNASNGKSTTWHQSQQRQKRWLQTSTLTNMDAEHPASQIQWHTERIIPHDPMGCNSSYAWNIRLYCKPVNGMHMLIKTEACTSHRHREKSWWSRKSVHYQSSQQTSKHLELLILNLRKLVFL